MSLRNDRPQNIQMELDFSSSLTGEAREAGREEMESFPVASARQSPASTNRLMEEVCERENLKEAGLPPPKGKILPLQAFEAGFFEGPGGTS